MAKRFKTLDDQIEYLEKSKNIVFGDKEKAKIFLLENNYFNVVSSTKIFFCKAYNNGHLYESTKFDEWILRYTNDQNLSFIVFRYIALIEKKINSKLAYYVSEMIEDKYFTEKELSMVKDVINNSIRNGRKLPAYNFEETWVYITNFTFGGTHALIKKLRIMRDYRSDKGENFRLISDVISEVEKINSKLNIKKDIHYLIELRNFAGHNIPLNIFIMSGSTKNDRRKRINILKCVASESDSRESMSIFIDELQKAATKYIEIRG
ncbi:MAG: Abi family protein [Culicoidibacterales bacterium]